ncbi:MAG: glycosyl hydrolase [Thermoproteota archaeon]
MDLKEFKNPSKEYRPSPFWSWNNLLDNCELRRQVQEFADKGFGGYFMHSRMGLATPYLSEEWMKCVEACLDEGVKRNIDSWLYDEDKWPSGFAGGIVTAKGDEYRSRMLVMREFKKEDLEKCFADPSILAVFEVRSSSLNVIESSKRLQSTGDATGNGRILVFKVEVGERSNWYNGESYADLLNPRVTEEFLRVTIDEYAKRFKGEFGKHIPGIFTDEPNFCIRWGLSEELPWTGEMAEYFIKLNRYDLVDRLPLLFFEGDGCNKVRYDFWRTVTRRFIESWTIPYSRKCDEYGLKMTGHYLCEDNLVIQTRYIGAAMPHYEYMHIPGIDHLGRNINDALTLKQCSSVANQFGIKRVLCEIFGCSGHSMTFEDQKWIADFHFALGITFLCQHLTLYTQKGDGKRDFPPTISYHQPYWPYYRLINDYFSRASYLCSQGSFYSDILVLNPIGSVWATYAPSLFGKNDSPLWKYNDAFVRLIENLLMLHWEFDIGDETVMEKYAKVMDGGLIRVKESSYRLVIVPSSLTWSRSTFNMMVEFLNSGGRVIFLGEAPRLIDGAPAEEEWRKALSHLNVVCLPEDFDALDKALNNVLQRSANIRDEAGKEIGDIFLHHRVDAPYHIYFFSNRSRNQNYNATIVFKEKGIIDELDLFTGEVKKVEAAPSESGLKIKILFPPAGSHAYILDASKPSVFKKEGKHASRIEEKVVSLPDTWVFERLHLNSLTLDKCQYSVNDEEWSNIMPIWRVRHEVLKKAGMLQYLVIQPWVLNKKGIMVPERLALRLRTTFKSELKTGKVYLVLEKASLWKLAVNGVQVPTETGDWYWDRQMGKIDITEYVKTGENKIELSCDYSLETPIEDIYIVGEFAVKKVEEEFVLTEEPSFIKSGSWVDQGYPFYAGTMRYKARFSLPVEAESQVLVRFPSAKGTLFLVYVNHKGPVPVCWSPLEADITDLMKKGENELEIDVVSSLRNTFGPLHHRLGDDLTFVSPQTFVDEANWVDEYQFAPYGLMEGAEIVVRRTGS